MEDSCWLVLEDGTALRGLRAGAPVRGYGEVVFNTSMTGYEEILTDPSYSGQIVTMTFPLIGNYGTNLMDIESRRVQAAGLVVREECERPSHWQSGESLREFLERRGIPAVAGVDTRALTRRLRSGGVMMAAIWPEATAEGALEWLQRQPPYGSTDLARAVSTSEPYAWEASPGAQLEGEQEAPAGAGHGLAPETAGHIIVLDAGVKYNILRILNARGYRTTVLPCTARADEVLALRPDGVVLSPGPGDPVMLDYVVQNVRGLVGKAPILGICLGHQVLGQVFGASTHKLKFGHHGGNHPVMDLQTERVYITSQNHGYTVDGDQLRNGAEVSHINLNDQTCEGLRHRELPIISIQYHSEAAPGPRDNVYIFDRFIDLIRAESGSRAPAS